MTQELAPYTFEFGDIARDPRWPHVEGCKGECFGCYLERAVLEHGGKQGRDFILGRTPDAASEKVRREVAVNLEKIAKWYEDDGWYQMAVLVREQAAKLLEGLDP